MRLLNKKFARKTTAAALVLATAATLATGAFAAEAVSYTHLTLPTT